MSLDVSIPIKFVNWQQKAFVENEMRNGCFNGGYGNGKTYAGCMKILLLACKFPKSRWIIARNTYKDLMQTTVKTFFKLCPDKLYEKEHGGKYVETKGQLQLINGSEILFMHFDGLDENSIKSLECNGILIDQAEEVSENTYLHLDARVGRWDMGEVPEELLKDNPNWPRNPLTNRPIVPQYTLLLCNPADEGELHWIWQRFHPESPEWQQKYKDSHYYIEATSRENVALSKETLDAMSSRDKAWTDRFIDGKWGKSGGQVHIVHPESILDVDETFVRALVRKGLLYRILDHGGKSPTCCLWVASYNKCYIVYKEYYKDDTLISEHRANIDALSYYYNEKGDLVPEEYCRNLADPDIFVKKNQSKNGFWAVAEEYLDPTIEDSKPIAWAPADNNEMATRNRISEYLRLRKDIQHPVTGKSPAPKLYFVQRNLANPNGCYHAIREIKAQKYELLDTVNGRPIFSDERDSKNIPNHSYDCIRYFCADHAGSFKEKEREPGQHSFKGIQYRLKALKNSKYFGSYGLPTR